MKKVLLITALFTSSVAMSTTEVTGNENPMSKVVITATDGIKERVLNVRNELASTGYSIEMINDLFGDDNLYFPTDEEKLNTVYYIIDLLIDNEQYEETDKAALLSLANDAYGTFVKRLKQSPITVHNE